jgi:hypothetical protein
VGVPLVQIDYEIGPLPPGFTLGAFAALLRDEFRRRWPLAVIHITRSSDGNAGWRTMGVPPRMLRAAVISAWRVARAP